MTPSIYIQRRIADNPDFQGTKHDRHSCVVDLAKEATQ
jgi:hypothetical protein